MSRRTGPLLALLLSVSLLLTGCAASTTSAGSGSAGNGAASSGSGGGVSSSAGAGGSGQDPTGSSSSAPDGSSAATCPTSNTKAFAKTRFVLHAGEAFGVFHRYLYKPYLAGTFRKGAPGRIRAYLKAGVAVLFIKRQVRLATEDAQANPTLCQAVAAPLGQLGSSLSGAVDQLRSGDTSGIEGLNTLVGGLQSTARRSGVAVPDNQTAAP